MKYIDCGRCAKTRIPYNDAATIDDKVYCADCINKEFSDEKQLEGKQVVKHHDPTVCSSCGKDNGILPLNKLANYPVCEDCETRIKDKVFPKWVKAFFAFIILVVVFSFAWNWRFYMSYKRLKEANVEAGKGNYEKATFLLNKSIENTPEVKDLFILYAYYDGLLLMTKDSSAEALEEFKKCKNELPENYRINELILRSRVGASFDDKDYNTFLSASQEVLALDTTEAMSYAGVASAYACLYSVNGKDSTKLLAVQNLDKAKSIDSTGKKIKDYFNKIEYRIYSRQILKTADFTKKYPTGWTKN